MFIGITGKMGVGKDYILSNKIKPLLDKLNVKNLQVSFADQIKVNVMTIANISFEDVYKQKTQKTRKLLQQEGTENGRNLYGKNIWISYFDNWTKVHKSRGIDVILIGDVRFKNEYDYIKKNDGIIIKVVAPERNKQRLNQESGGDLTIIENIKTHQSECDLDEITDFDLIIDNDLDSDSDSDSDIINNEFTLLINKLLVERRWKELKLN
jgi:phosphomevalonate kinase